MSFNYKQLISQAGSYTQFDMTIAIIAIILLLEACRRVVGLPILIKKAAAPMMGGMICPPVEAAASTAAANSGR